MTASNTRAPTSKDPLQDINSCSYFHTWILWSISKAGFTAIVMLYSVRKTCIGSNEVDSQIKFLDFVDS